MKLVAAPDKFRGTATAREMAAAIGRAAATAGVDCIEVPMADGGEGLLDVLGGPDRSTVVTGPLGDPVEAGWRLDRGTAVIEMARVAGLE
ncbi:MAG: glycerate kinase, partial [Acidimicrobiaceae bacterium]|nr:glycerate kinase [Acidimicrobiaceae bacterium]